MTANPVRTISIVCPVCGVQTSLNRVHGKWVMATHYGVGNEVYVGRYRFIAIQFGKECPASGKEVERK